MTTDDFEPYPPSDLATLFAAASVLERLATETTARMRALPAAEQRLTNAGYDTLFRSLGEYQRLAGELRAVKLPPVEGEV